MSLLRKSGMPPCSPSWPCPGSRPGPAVSWARSSVHMACMSSTTGKTAFNKIALKLRRAFAADWRNHYKTFIWVAAAAALWMVMKLLGVPMDEASRYTISGGIAVISLGVIVAVWLVYFWYRTVFGWFRGPKTTGAATGTAADADGDQEGGPTA